jgi:hypothetical protein
VESLAVSAKYAGVRPVLVDGSYAPSMGRRRNLAALALLLLAASLPGILNVVAKDHVSTTEGIIAWISVVAFGVAIITLLMTLLLGGVARLRRVADPSD